MAELTNDEKIEFQVSNINNFLKYIEKHPDSKTMSPTQHTVIFFDEGDAHVVGDFINENTGINVTYGEDVSIPRYNKPFAVMTFDVVTGNDGGYLLNQQVVAIAHTMDIMCLALSPDTREFKPTFISDPRLQIPAFGLITNSGHAVMLHKQFKDCTEGDEKQRNIEIRENQVFFTNVFVKSMREILPELMNRKGVDIR